MSENVHHAHLKYRPYVDGLRAVAVLPVILFHAGLGFTGGYVGVDVFFVISGFLITGLILKDVYVDNFHITEFWERRVRRIMPALAVVVLFCLVMGWFLYFPADYKDLGKSSIAQVLLVSNFYFYQDAGYFAQGVDMKPLLHTWSLAVEEQFYLLFPFFLVGVKRISRKAIVPFIVALCGVSFLLSVYCSYKHGRMNFYLLPTRAWELGIGAFFAAIPPQQKSIRWLTEFLSALGLAMIFWAVFYYDSNTRFPGASAILPCVGAGLIIWANGHTLTSTGKILASPPMVFIGLISYSLYLWHWPLIVFYKYAVVGPLPPLQEALILVTSIVLATLSWRFVETPFRKRVIFDQQAQIFSFAGVTTAVLLLLSVAIFKLQGMPSRIPAAAMQYLNGKTFGDAGPTFNRSLTLADARNGDFREIGKTNKDLPITLLVWGDSHAEVETPVLEALCKDHAARGVVVTHSQTAPLADYVSKGEWSLNAESIPFNAAVIDYIRAKHVANVLLIARWDYYVDIDKGTGRLRDSVLATIKALQSSGAKIWIMRQVPKYPWNVPKGLATAVLRGHDPENLGLTISEYREQSQTQDPIFAGLNSKDPSVTVLDPAPLFTTSSGRCRIAQNGEALYWDADHVNIAGAMMLRPLFEPIFAGNGKAAALVQDKSSN